MCCINTQEVRDDVEQKQGIEAASALLRALEAKIKVTPKTFTTILNILEGLLFTKVEFAAQMREQCEAREVTGVPSIDHETREGTAAQQPLGHPEASGKHETKEGTAIQRPLGRPEAPSHLETREGNAIHRPLGHPEAPGHHETRERTATQRPPAHPESPSHHETRKGIATQTPPSYPESPSQHRAREETTTQRPGHPEALGHHPGAPAHHPGAPAHHPEAPGDHETSEATATQRPPRQPAHDIATANRVPQPHPGTCISTCVCMYVCESVVARLV